MNKEKVKEHFAKQADDYEKLMARLIPQYLEQHRIIYNLLPVGDKSYRVLDLGCGNGVLAELVLEKLPGAFVEAFDLTEEMLAAAEIKLSKYPGRFVTRQGDFRTDPIGNGYDIIMAGLTLHHLTWEERAPFYRHIFSALNPEGLFLARDIIIDEDRNVAEEQYRYWKEFMRSRGEDPDFWYIKHIGKDHPITLKDHFSRLKKAGFTRVACHWRLYNFAITTARK